MLKFAETLRGDVVPFGWYLPNAKMKKQMSYADAKKIPFVLIVGGDEMQSGLLSLKNMTTGEQEKLNIESIINKLT